MVFYGDPSADESLGHGDMASIHCVPPYDDFLQHKLAGYFKAEAVVLRPGDLL